MQQHTNHDTSTQAMTEVALGLSMAFFSLLILALFSIGMPQQTQDYDLTKKPIKKSQNPLNTDEQLKLIGNNPKDASKKSSSNKKQQYAFYYNGQFYDKQLNRLTIDSFSQFESQLPLILAVEDNLPLIQVMAAREQINHPNLSITMLNQKWQTQLEQIQ